jgi:hypothetical protein
MQEKSTESFYKSQDKDIMHYKMETGIKPFRQGIYFFSGSEIEDVLSERIKNPSYGEVDLRLEKASSLSTLSGIYKTVSEMLSHNVALASDVQLETNAFVSNILTNCKYFTSNKSAAQDPKKFIIEVFNKIKTVGIGKIIPIDIDENRLFEGLGLKNDSDVDRLFDIITEYHNALKCGKGIEKAAKDLKDKYFKILIERYVAVLTEISHSIYWTATALELLPVYNKYYGTLPPKRWFLYPFIAQITSYFSRSEPNMSCIMGPPLDLFEKPPFPGKMYISASVYFKYTSSLFGKIKLFRNSKEY